MSANKTTKAHSHMRGNYDTLKYAVCNTCQSPIHSFSFHSTQKPNLSSYITFKFIPFDPPTDRERMVTCI